MAMAETALVLNPRIKISSPLTRLLAMRRKKMEERDGAAGVGSVSPLAAELAPTGAAAAEAQQQPPPAASLSSGTGVSSYGTVDAATPNVIMMR